MKNVFYEQRLALLRRVLAKINEGWLEEVILAGSMALDNGFSVHKDSDVDLILLVKAGNIFKLMENSFLRSKFFTLEAANHFKNNRVDAIWTDSFLEEIMFNLGIVSKDFLTDFCAGKVLEMRYFKTYLRKTSWIEQTMRGEEVLLKGRLKKVAGGYVLTRDLYWQGEMVSSPFLASLFFGKFILDKRGAAAAEIKEFRKRLIKKYNQTELESLFAFDLKKSRPGLLGKIKRTILS
ncbi:MAG: hypothetical protein JW991_02470 [Candidatus Pacebacteria bacterium]|nr:hypothetical protein [Candidatus Paceibacterota bacterium]